MDKHVSDLDAERLFADVSDPDPAEPLTRFTADLRATYVATPAEPTRAAHLQAMTETFAGLVASGRPTAAPAKRRRRFAVRGTIAAAGLVLVGGSAMAATGTLPDAAQDAVSDVARRIGVQLPRAKPADIRIVHPDVDRSDIKVADKKTEKTSSQTDDDDRVSSADDDNDSVSSLTDPSGREPRRPRRNANDGGTTVIDDGGSSTPDDPSSDGGSDDGGIDGRGDPSGGGGGSTDPDPGDGGGSTDPDPDPGDGGDGGGGRGDPKDGSSPSGADAGANEPAAPGAG